MTRNMPIEKAKRIVKEFTENGYNQKDALLKTGYKESTASSESGKVISRAFRTIARDNLERLEGKQNGKRSLLEMVGMTQDNVLAEYLYIAQQDKDLTNKLKALVPLLKELGITWEEKNTLVAPTLNLTVKQNTPELRLNEAISEDVAQYALSTTQSEPVGDNDTDNMAQQSNIIKAEGGFDSQNQDKKEGESHIRNISENSTIDNSLNI